MRCEEAVASGGSREPRSAFPPSKTTRRRRRGAPLLVRRAVGVDIPGILHCLRTAFEPYRPDYSPGAYLGTILTARSAARRLQNLVVFVTKGIRGEIIGTVSLQRVSPSHGHLRGMAVLPERQGSGTGGALLDAALMLARQRRYRRVTLEITAPLLRARRFYVRHGFRRTGRTRVWRGMVLTEFEIVLEDAQPRRSAGTGGRQQSSRNGGGVRSLS